MHDIHNRVAQCVGEDGLLDTLKLDNLLLVAKILKHLQHKKTETSVFDIDVYKQVYSCMIKNSEGSDCLDMSSINIRQTEGVNETNEPTYDSVMIMYKNKDMADFYHIINLQQTMDDKKLTALVRHYVTNIKQSTKRLLNYVGTYEIMFTKIGTDPSNTNKYECLNKLSKILD